MKTNARKKSRRLTAGAVAVIGAAALGMAGAAWATDLPGTVSVASSEELQDAVDNASPGDVINMQDAVYDLNLVISTSGEEDDPITLRGGRDAVIDGGDNSSGYAVALEASHWSLEGFSIRNAKKGLMATGASSNVLDGLKVSDIGEEGIHFRESSSDNVVQNSEVRDTGQVTEDYGEAIYLGSAKNHWPDGEPDPSNRNKVLNNKLGPNVTAEHVDIKEGSTGGQVSGNTFDGTGQTGANSGESWVSAKGNEYTISDNDGSAVYMSGYKARNRVDGWGCGNVFSANTGSVAPYQEDGWGFDIKNEGCETDNIVCDDNNVTDAAEGDSNVDMTSCSRRGLGR